MEIKSILMEALNSIDVRRSISPRSRIERSALRWELYAVLQNLLDATAMIVADLGLRKPVSYADLDIVLYEANLLDREDVERMKIVAETRNTLAHAYRKLSDRELIEIVNSVLPIVEKLISKLMKIVEERDLDPPRDLVAAWGRAVDVFQRYGVAIAILFAKR